MKVVTKKTLRCHKPNPKPNPSPNHNSSLTENNTKWGIWYKKTAGPHFHFKTRNIHSRFDCFTVYQWNMFHSTFTSRTCSVTFQWSPVELILNNYCKVYWIDITRPLSYLVIRQKIHRHFCSIFQHSTHRQPVHRKLRRPALLRDWLLRVPVLPPTQEPQVARKQQ